MTAAPLIPYLPTEELTLRLVPAGAFGGGFPTSPIAVQPFGVLVATGVWVGAYLTLRQTRRLGLDEQKMTSLITWVVGMGFVLGHVLDVVFYLPDQLARDPWLLFRLWEGLSSFGGFVGGVVGALIWWQRSGERLLPYADVIASSLPVGWAFGRAGCSVAHDHPGRFSDAWFAVQYPEGGRFDLGLYEFVLMLPIVAAFLALRRRPRPWGFYLAALSLAYAPMRFALDFLRTEDARYGALTPAQWGCLLLLGVGVWMFVTALNAAGERAAVAPPGIPEPVPPSDAEA